MLPLTEISDDDEAWLCAWVRRRDHAAFRALVGKYAGLVYATALRKLGRADWAEEIVQEVFIVFARQSAGLRGGGGLPAWLYRAAVFKAAARLRAEIRHRGRMEKLAALAPEGETPDGQVCGTVSERDWAAMRPLLDDAVASLPERDRRVILLHYFEHKSYAQVAALSGGSQEAVRKRGLRALEKLRKILRRRGVGFPAAVIGGGLSRAFQEAASASLPPLTTQAAAAAGIAAATLAGSGGVFLSIFSISSCFTMKTSLAAAALVFAAGSTAVWWSLGQPPPSGPVPGGPPPTVSLPAGIRPEPRPGPLSELPSSGQKRAVLIAVENQSVLPPVPSATTPKNPLSEKPDPALKERFQNDPRTKKAERRINALKGGFKGLLDSQLQGFNVRNNLIGEAERRSRDSSLSPAEKATAQAKIDKLTAEKEQITEQIGKFSKEAEVWLQSEVMIQRDDILDQIAKEGGATSPLPPPEPDTPDAVNFPEFRSAGDLMAGEQFGEALTAFSNLAKNSTGKVRDQSYWNALLCGLITGNEEAVVSASLPLLRSTPSSACFAMAAKAIQQNEWGDAQVWVTQALQSGDVTENHTFLEAMEGLGWAEANQNRLVPPPDPERSGG